MFFGILLALMICGGITVACNPLNIKVHDYMLREHRANMRLLGVCLVFVGGFGAIGWVLEVRHIL